MQAPNAFDRDSNGADACYRLQLLGNFEINTARGDPVAITSRRARALLSYLYIQPHRAQSRSRLAGLLWSDRGEGQARASLRQCLVELRGALDVDGKTVVHAGRDEVSLVKSAFSSDIQDVRNALNAPGGEPLASLLRHAGEHVVLENIDVPGLFEDWLIPTRELFEQDIANGVYARLRQAEQQGDWLQVRQLADAYLIRNATDEIVATLGMKAEAALGDVSAARRRFQRLTAALQKTFQAKPGRDAQAAFAALANLHDQNGIVVAARGDPAAVADVESQSPLVVVAAFEAADRDGEDAYLSAAICDEVLAGLSYFREFRVTAASSGVSDPHLQAATRHGAAYILGARMRRSAEKVRLLAQLIRASDQEVIWSERIETAETSVSATIEHIIVKVVGAVSPTIDIDMERRARGPSNSVYHRYVAARSEAERPSSHQAARAAAADLEALIHDNPDFSLAYLPLARLYNTDFTYTQARSTGWAERERAFYLAKAALAIDRRDMYAYTVVGWCYLRRRNWDVARAHFQQAVRLNPFHADRLMDAGFGHLCLGDVDMAASLFERCAPLTSTPKDRYYIDMGVLEMVRGDHARAAIQFDLVARPTVWVLLYRAVNAILSGRASAELNAAARTSVEAIWPAQPAVDPDLLAGWIRDHHPLAEPDFADLFLSAALQALA